MPPLWKYMISTFISCHIHLALNITHFQGVQVNVTKTSWMCRWWTLCLDHSLLQVNVSSNTLYSIEAQRYKSILWYTLCLLPFCIPCRNQLSGRIFCNCWLQFLFLGGLPLSPCFSHSFQLDCGSLCRRLL